MTNILPPTAIRSRSTNRLYRIWGSMKQRCTNPNASGYRYYGGKGVTICEEWLNFDAFKEWALEKGYEDDPAVKGAKALSIDRIDPSGNYCPENCRWITISENTAWANVNADGTGYVARNPDGRPNILTNPVQMTIQFEGRSLEIIDQIAKIHSTPKKKTTRAQVIRDLVDAQLIKLGLLSSMGTADDESEEEDE